MKKKSICFTDTGGGEHADNAWYKFAMRSPLFQTQQSALYISLTLSSEIIGYEQ